MVKHKKYRVLGVAFVLLLVLSMGLIIPTYAEKTTSDQVIETVLTCETLAEKYGLYIKETAIENQFVVVRDSSFADSCSNNEGKKDDLKLIKINDVGQTDNKVLDAKTKEITFTANFIATGNLQKISITFQSVQDPDTTVEVIHEVTKEENDVRDEKEPNSNYYGVCASYRVFAAQQTQEAREYFEDAVSYCYKENVPKGTNYTQTETEDKITLAKANWEAFSDDGDSTDGPSSFNEKFNEIKNRVNYYNENNPRSPKHTIDTTKQPAQFSAKCKYNFVKKETAVYTNEYGETISSDDDYYLNKDYYLGTETTYSGSGYKYTYHYAPGNTQTKPLKVDPETNKAAATCKKTCEEAIKLEYGPPIASKAGLCFEYKVKVTSYVKCKTKFTAKPPEQTTRYCNPAPRCVSPSGIERQKPQAGPIDEFDSCIAECDGGKYTQACSKKCYNEIYANEKGIKKLAVNFEMAQAKKLANNSYSLDQCLEDNKNYYGCYIYSGGRILWKRSGAYSPGSKYSLGRWYIDVGYDTSAIGTAVGQYIADAEGFYRHKYATGLCTDYCSWRTDCGSDVYLNPGTAVKDYKENEKTYEAARNACAAKVTCSTRTTNITISIKYDEVNGTEPEIKTFPTDTEGKKDTITSKGERPEGEVKEPQADTFGAQRSTLLQRDGCYSKKTAKNWYLAEWSFPGTYIHNKTGEISFKLPEETSGWYYEDKKFCMPLNAKSVNTKWWEWYQVARTNWENSCYTQTQIEAELATNDTTTSNGYNIKAIAENFGYLGWNLDVSCFYALRNEVCNVDEEQTKKCCTTKCVGSGCNNECVGDNCNKQKCNTTTGTDCYIVRVVDRKDLFPNKPVAGVVSNKTRPIGFNWTNGAKIMRLKNPDYSIEPSTLIEAIQENADTLHSNSKLLEYQFHLTPSTLRKIKEYNHKDESEEEDDDKGNHYGSWEGTTKLINGVHVYQSNLWYSTGGKPAILEAGEYLKLGEIGKNNVWLGKVKVGGQINE